MSDTENQENLSVEDILSSIKNILVDDEGSPIENSISEENSIPETIAMTTAEETSDVFNLDDSMIVTPEEKSVETPVAVEKPALETTTLDFLNNNGNLQESFPMAESTNINDIPEFNNLENNSSATRPQEDAPTSIQDIVNSITLEEPTVSAKKETTVSGPVVREETIDTSASLINNFAKVFAEKQREQAQLKLNAQLTEEVVAKAIQDKLESLNIPSLVQEEILSQVKTQAGNIFETLASKIITELTQKWIESNLQQVVEKVVTAEIERVIAKVEV